MQNQSKTILQPGAPGFDPTAKAGPILAFHGVTHRYVTERPIDLADGQPIMAPVAPVLDNINLKLMPGSFHFLTGSSGAGKSTLLKLMYLGLTPSDGRLEVFGKDIVDLPRAQLPRLRRRIGVVFQDFRLLPHLSVLENVALPLRLAGARENQIKVHVSELLRWVGLGDYMHATPQSLSGGQQQRVAIARAVINRPALLLADEPTGNVDDEIGFRLMHLFVELNKLGTTVVVATHNQNLIDRIAKPVLTIANGRVEKVV